MSEMTPAELIKEVESTFVSTSGYMAREGVDIECDFIAYIEEGENAGQIVEKGSLHACISKGVNIMNEDADLLILMDHAGMFQEVGDYVVMVEKS